MTSWYLGEVVDELLAPEDLQYAATDGTTGSWKQVRGHSPVYLPACRVLWFHSPGGVTGRQPGVLIVGQEMDLQAESGAMPDTAPMVWQGPS